MDDTGLLPSSGGPSAAARPGDALAQVILTDPARRRTTPPRPPDAPRRRTHQPITPQSGHALAMGIDISLSSLESAFRAAATTGGTTGGAGGSALTVSRAGTDDLGGRGRRRDRRAIDSGASSTRTSTDDRPATDGPRRTADTTDTQQHPYPN
ncbi:hypothetical protein ACTMS2_21340 [Micromonospora sp. SD12]|uniref:hypothetical protein n=1 Tax=Micromonospora sp. SD12 TaxID=3452216 RepID=UPI003F8C1ABA